MTRRRAVCIGLASALGCGLARAQPAAAKGQRRIGVLALNPDRFPATLPSERPFAKFLRTRGWAEGENILTDRAFADYRADRLPGPVRQLLGNGAELLYVVGGDAAVAAARATTSVPIVFNEVAYTLEQGLIDSYARPGRNATGVSEFIGPEQAHKRIQFMREVAPDARRLGWLWGSGVTETVAGGRFDFVSPTRAAASTLGFESHFFDVRSPEGIEAALATALERRVQVLQASSIYAVLKIQVIAEFCLRHRLPCATPAVAAVEATDVLFGFGTPRAEFGAPQLRSFDMVDGILRGANPAEIPVELPTRTELVVNMKTARTIGVTVPPALRLRADRVID